jgi:peptidoglycan/xylan/chitin deacetylase (PgdA/CDA1 family)
MAERPAILMYHRVAALAPDTFGLCLHPDAFGEQIAWLARERTVLPLATLCEAALAGRAPDRAVALTFDDGTLDALPAARELARLGLPATFFVTTARLDEPHEAWWDVLEQLFIAPGELPPRLELAGVALPCVTPAERQEVHARLREQLLQLPAAERDARVEEVRRWSRRRLPPRDSHRLLLRAELDELARLPGCTLGAHSHSHAWLPALPLEDQAREVEQCRAPLGEALECFAYPFGARDPRTESVVEQAGYRFAVTTVERALGPGEHRLRLPRVAAPAGGAAALAAHLAAVQRS